jgi:hypothetical protein
VQARLCAALCVVLDKREVLKCGGRVSLRHSTFNSNFSLQELEAFINDQACHPNGVLDFPEFLNVLSRLICDSLDVAVMPVMPAPVPVCVCRAASVGPAGLLILQPCLGSVSAFALLYVETHTLNHVFVRMLVQPDIDEAAMQRTFDSWYHRLCMCVGGCWYVCVCVCTRA